LAIVGYNGLRASDSGPAEKQQPGALGRLAAACAATLNVARVTALGPGPMGQLRRLLPRNVPYNNAICRRHSVHDVRRLDEKSLEAWSRFAATDEAGTNRAL